MAGEKLHTAMRIYDGAWRLAIPLMRANRRLADGFYEKKLQVALPAADLWIHSASGGEAYLAWTLMDKLQPAGPLRVLVTTNTRQGLGIIENAAAELEKTRPKLTVSTAWFPFDRPSIMEKAVSQVNPRLAVLLESELWPGFIRALKGRGSRVFIINGRMTAKSMAFYQRFPGFCMALRPDRILAVSCADRKRFESVFGKNGVSVMPNIKFDRLAPGTEGNTAQKKTDRIGKIVPGNTCFLVLGSIRSEEEKKVSEMIQRVYRARPDVVTGLFPRHMHRIDKWKRILDGLGMKWRLRSAMKQPADAGQIILWDCFGELTSAYEAANAVFVGGSLAPLGGQNFLEPLICGSAAVIGPFWENFAWVGRAVFDQGLVIMAGNQYEAADHLLLHLNALGGTEKETVAARARQFITARQGGARRACEIIEKELFARQKGINHG